MHGDIVKLRSGSFGIDYAGTYIATRDNMLNLHSNPITEVLAPTKSTTLSVAEAMARVASPHSNTSGTDPEVFVFAPDGEVIPAWEFLPDKANALQTYRQGWPEAACPKVLAYWDGAQAELTLTAGEACHAQLTDSIRFGLKTIYDAAQAYMPGSYLECRDVVKIPENVLMEAEDHHIALGCSPSANAYKTVKPIDIGDPRLHPVRYSGCHLHFRVREMPTHHKDSKLAWGTGTTYLPEWFPGGTIKMFDRVVGLLLTALGRDLEDPLRRKAYGRPGEYRQTCPTGVEYRTPGAFVLCRPEVLNFALDMGRRAWGLGLLYNPETFFLPGAMDIIQHCDADAAWKRIEEFAPFFKAMFRGNNYSDEGTMEILRKGLKAHGLVGTMKENWKLDKETESATDNTSWRTHNDGNRHDWRMLSLQAVKAIAVPQSAVMPQAA